MHRASKITSRFLRRFWRGLREWCGDSAYERYLRCASAKSGAAHPLTPEEFYVERLNRHYSRPNRCC
jgi:uncharacterized short protein YbdD (DUF466 family)